MRIYRFFGNTFCVWHTFMSLCGNFENVFVTILSNWGGIDSKSF